MKRGKDEEKVMGPMFPRLHVNDAEKGGPRAPPRNKMALYEQFSIPSQRFNSSLLPLNPNSSCKTVTPPSSSQGSGSERSYVFPGHLSSQNPTHHESYISHQSDGANPNTLAQLEQRETVDEDDFTVPVYVHSRKGQSNVRTLESFNGRKLTPMGSRNFDCSVAVQNMRKDVRSKSEGLPQVSSSRDQPIMSVKNISSGETMDSLVRQVKTTPNQECQDFSESNISRCDRADACLRQECVAGPESKDIGHGDGLLESTRDTDKGNTLVPSGYFSAADQTCCPLEATCDTGYHNSRTVENLEESDRVSKISAVENLSCQKMSPDDVVGILGQKHFLKARRELVKAVSSLKILYYVGEGPL